MARTGLLLLGLSLSVGGPRRSTDAAQLLQGQPQLLRLAIAVQREELSDRQLEARAEGLKQCGLLRINPMISTISTSFTTICVCE